MLKLACSGGGGQKRPPAERDVSGATSQPPASTVMYEGLKENATV